MGTVKLGNIKQRRHLKNSIEYIFRPDKTKNGAYIFGDSGYTPQMVCDTFYVTKKFFGKEDGRQAYHFVLTFAEEDDINPAMAEEITKEYWQAFHADTDFLVEFDQVETKIIYMPFRETDESLSLIPVYEVITEGSILTEEDRMLVLIDALTGYVYTQSFAE